MVFKKQQLTIKIQMLIVWFLRLLETTWMQSTKR